MLKKMELISSRKIELHMIQCVAKASKANADEILTVFMSKKGRWHIKSTNSSKLLVSY